MSCFVIAEAGINHNGSIESALRLVDAAAAAGADAVKFQTFRAERLVRPGAEKAEYQHRYTSEGDQFSMLRALELPDAAYPRLFARCHQLNIEFLSTPFDKEAAEMLVHLGMRRIKVPSGEITNFPFLEYLAALKRSIILSTGMSTLDEVSEAVAVLRAAWQRAKVEFASDMLTLLHCTSNYPTTPEDVNLCAMLTLRDAFGTPVGYSDHTEGVAVAVAAAAMGAAVVEKHFTLDRKLPGPDHKASLEPAELSRMVREIRIVEMALGDGAKRPRARELPMRDLVRRSVTLTRAVRAGETIRREDLTLLRPGTGIPPKEMDAVANKRAARDLPAGTTLSWKDLVS